MEKERGGWEMRRIGDEKWEERLGGGGTNCEEEEDKRE